MPLPPSAYSSGPVSPQQLNTDMYAGTANAPNGINFHAHRPLLSETIISGGTAYSSGLSPQPVPSSGVVAFSVIDTSALFSAGTDYPGNNASFRFTNVMPASGGSIGLTGGCWLTWGFPVTGPVTVPPGGVGAGLGTGNSMLSTGTFQYGNPVHNNCPFHLDLVQPGSAANLWKPFFWWLTPSTPTINGNNTDTSGQTTRMGWLWTGVSPGYGGTVSAVPSVPLNWGTVTSAGFNAMGSAFTLLNNPPMLRNVTASGQTISSGSITVIQFTNTAGVDSYSGWSTASSSYTASLPGLYLFSPAIVWGTASSSGDRWCGLQVSAGGTTANYQGAAYVATPVGPGVSGAGLTATSIARVLSLNAGDKVAAYGLQTSGGNIPVYTGLQSHIIGAYMTPQAAAGTTLSYTAPAASFRWQAGALGGTALTAALNARIGNDVSFLLNRPYFTGYQQTAQSGFAAGTAFQKVAIDALGALPRGGNGDSYTGWSTANHWYASQVAGWYLVVADLYATPPAATTATLTAGIFCSSSGSITPVSSPDAYQQPYYPLAGGAPPPGATAIGLYYLQPGEYVYPMLAAQNWGGTWGTYVQTSGALVSSQFSCFWVAE